MARIIKKEKEVVKKILELLKEVSPYELDSKLNLYEINVYYKMLRLGVIKVARSIKKEKEAMKKILELLKEVPPYELGSKLNLYELNIYYKMLRLGIIKENKKW